MYAELSYFEGYHFQHIADYHEDRRIRRLTAVARRAIQGTSLKRRAVTIRTQVGAT